MPDCGPTSTRAGALRSYAPTFNGHSKLRSTLPAASLTPRQSRVAAATRSARGVIAQTARRSPVTLVRPFRCRGSALRSVSLRPLDVVGVDRAAGAVFGFGTVDRQVSWPAIPDPA
ncbi:hypothetical protein AcW1_010221 [Taiwanofungus camphoratus]|nr:hypothetical protein AcW1_010221 [Antrodia cinnamomea]